MGLSHKKQIKLTRITIKAGQILLQHGAESQLVEQTTQRIGIALGASSIELSVSLDAIVLTSIFGSDCVTTTRRCYDRGINMQMVCDVQRICVMLEKKLLDTDQVSDRLNRLEPYYYNRYLVALMIGLSCSSFSHFFGGDWPVYITSFFASCSAMILRQELAARQHNPFVIFALSAFLATSIASLGVIYDFGEKPQIAIAASVLLLVPGFPFINAISDVLKGHISTGIARWVFATLLTISVSFGIITSLALINVSLGWII
ncbi:threonine/serine ThrE exporter family protein [Psychromonas sp. CD1]|uniref:threonine/serine ThrE exporter family protein n=1 Tax=Psychromonas sp. CD1 TaxID=1979839 RepID=UPI000B9B0CBF|nr:threonine/serine exporter family protein [Psychromonas sp. CD1]